MLRDRAAAGAPASSSSKDADDEAGRLQEFVADDFEIVDKLYVNGDSSVFKARARHPLAQLGSRGGAGGGGLAASGPPPGSPGPRPLAAAAAFTGPLVAIKQRAFSELGRNADILHEVKVNLIHPHVVRCYGAFWRPKHALNMVFEWADGGDLLSVVRARKNRGKYLPEADIWRWAWQLFSALDGLHKRRIIHRDVKCSNLLLFSRPKPTPAGASSSSSSASSSATGEAGGFGPLAAAAASNPATSPTRRGLAGRGAEPDGSPRAGSSAAAATPSAASAAASSSSSSSSAPGTSRAAAVLPSPSDAPALYDLKVADMGVARRLGGGAGGPSSEFASTMYGTPLYMSPELVDVRGPKYSVKTDIWSAGVSMYELAALTSPFNGNSMAALAAGVRAGRYKPLPPIYTAELSDFLGRTLRVDPDKRPTAREAAELCEAWLTQNGTEPGEVEARRVEATVERRAALRAGERRGPSPPPVISAPALAAGGGGRPPISSRAFAYADRPVGDADLSLVQRAKAIAAAATAEAAAARAGAGGGRHTQQQQQQHQQPVVGALRPSTAPSVSRASAAAAAAAEPVPSSSSHAGAGVAPHPRSLLLAPPDSASASGSGPTAQHPALSRADDPYQSGLLLAQRIHANPKVVRVRVSKKEREREGAAAGPRHGGSSLGGAGEGWAGAGAGEWDGEGGGAPADDDVNQTHDSFLAPRSSSRDPRVTSSGGGARTHGAPSSTGGGGARPPSSPGVVDRWAPEQQQQQSPRRPQTAGGAEGRGGPTAPLPAPAAREPAERPRSAAASVASSSSGGTAVSALSFPWVPGNARPNRADMYLAQQDAALAAAEAARANDAPRSARSARPQSAPAPPSGASQGSARGHHHFPQADAHYRGLTAVADEGEDDDEEEEDGDGDGGGRRRRGRGMPPSSSPRARPQTPSSGDGVVWRDQASNKRAEVAERNRERWSRELAAAGQG
jgi:serine/threonine protein kinase